MRKLFILFSLFLTLSLSGQVHPGVVASKPVSVAFCTQYQTIYNAFAVKPAADTAIAQNTMVKTIVDGNGGTTWSKLEVFYVFATGRIAQSLQDWTQPGTYDITNISGTVWTKNEGYTGDGVADYLRTNLKTSLDSVIYKKNSASIGAYLRLDKNETGAAVGIQAIGTDQAVIRPHYSGNFDAAVNSAARDTKAVANSQGMYIATRTGTNVVNFYKGTTDLGTITRTSTAMQANQNVVFLMHDGSSYSTNQIASGFVGGGLTSTDVIVINNAVETYMDFLGKGVQ